jgi:hypothetical protein
MTVSRRLFLKAASGATLIVGFPQAVANIFGQDTRKGIQPPPTKGAARRKPLVSYNDPLYYYNSAAFSSYIGSTFRVYLSQQKSIDLVLIDVSELKPEIPGKDGFSLVFQGSVAKRFPGALYRLEHDALGTLSMMLGPINQNGITYEAVINRQYP